MLSKVVLLFGLTEEAGAALASAFAAAGFGVLPVPPERCSMPLAAILEGRQPLVPGNAPPEPMAVFHGLSDSELDRALAVLRKSGAVSLKAVTTPANLRWTPAELWKNLSAERKAIKHGKRRH